jgi:hypothetical protein
MFVYQNHGQVLSKGTRQGQKVQGLSAAGLKSFDEIKPL